MVLSAVGTWTTNLANRWSGIGATSATLDRDGTGFTPIPDWYEFVWQYYQSAAYALDSGQWGALKGRSGLPRTIRSVLPLVKPAVDWFPGHVYPTVRTDAGDVDRVPFRPDTPEEIVLAVRQAFVWGNWTSEILTFVFMAALFGEAFAEIEVDAERQKVYPVLHHPKYVTALEKNRSDDVVAYTLEIPMVAKNGTRYRWGKRVTKETVTTLKDGQPQGYDGQPAELPNPWGFVPAVFPQFRNVGLQHGASAADGLIAAIDELNGMQAGTNDYIRRFIEQTYMVASKDPAGLTRILGAATIQGATADLTAPQAIRQNQRVIPAPEGSSAFPLMQNLGLGEATAHFDRMLWALNRCTPWVTLAEQLREMSQVTGPGGRALVQDAQNVLDEVTGNLDSAVIKLGQMCLSIGGELANTGAWGLRSQLTRARQAFLPFRLASYARGDLDFALTPRELLPKTRLELAQEAAAIEALATPTGLMLAGLDAGQVYGVNPDGTAKMPPDLAEGETAGLLAEKSANRVSAAGAFGDLFASGQP